MKNIIILILSLAAFSLSSAQSSDEVNIPLSEPGKKGKLEVDIRYGSMEVVGTPRQDVLIRYTPLGGADLKITEANNGLKKITGGAPDLEIYEKQNVVSVESNSWNKGLALYIEVPRSFDLSLDGYNKGKVKVQNIEGEVVIESYNGGIEATGISGSLVADTYNGDILVSFDRISPDMPMAFMTYNGTIDISLPPSVKADLKLKSEAGDIYTGFDIDLLPASTQPKRVTEGGTRKTLFDGWIMGKINGGGPEFRMKNYHGDIYIRKK
ncbi:MAG: DUF4097 family beta strand repeat-containing protein [Saprospiraceae bacterium]|nr:DUF4097 family beta strand repeat-containing protein [Saprospiraceae bacterium]